MTMPDHIRDSVQAAVDQPVDTDELLRRVRNGTAGPRWTAPLAAAAAVVLLAGGAAVALQDRSASTTAAAGDVVVPFTNQQPGEGDVPPPSISARSGPAVPRCEPQDVTGRITWTATPASAGDLTGQARISLRDQAADVRVCELSSDDPVLVLLGPADGQVGPDSTFVGVPDVPQPPVTLRRIVDADRDVVVALSLSGSNCLPSNFGSLSGMEPRLLEIVFDGDKLPCDSTRPEADGALSIGMPHTEGVPAATLPEDRSDLRITPEVPDQLGEDQDTRYVVRLANPTAADISLSPCPAWQAVLSRKDGDGTTTDVVGGRLNCDQAPAEIPAGGHVLFEMIQPDPRVGQPGADDATEVELTWGIAGPEAATGSILLRTKASEDAEPTERRSYKVQYSGPVLIDGGSPDPQAQAVEQMRICLALPGVENLTEGVMLPANYRLEVVGSSQQQAFETCAEDVDGFELYDTSDEQTFIIRPDGVPEVDTYATAMTGCLNLPGVGATSISETRPLSYVAYAAGPAIADLDRCLDDVAGAAVEVQPGAPGSPVGLQEFIDRCVGREDAERAPDGYVGLTEQQLMDSSAGRTSPPRVVGHNRVCRDRTDDRQPDRVNVIIDDSTVVWAGLF